MTSLLRRQGNVGYARIRAAKEREFSWGVRIRLDTFILAGLGSGLGHLAGGLGLLDGLDDTDGNGLSHVTDGEATGGYWAKASTHMG